METPEKFIKAVETYHSLEIDKYATHNLRLMLSVLEDAGILDYETWNTARNKIENGKYVREAH